MPHVWKPLELSTTRRSQAAVPVNNTCTTTHQCFLVPVPSSADSSACSCLYLEIFSSCSALGTSSPESTLALSSSALQKENQGKKDVCTFDLAQLLLQRPNF